MSGQARLERALRRGGIAERAADGSYRVWRGRNRQRRCLGRLRAGRGDRMRADGLIEPLEGAMNLYVWAGPLDREVIVPRLPAAAMLAGSGVRRRSRTLVTRALQGAKTKAERLRLSDAASRFLADVESAQQSGQLTMNWTQLADGQSTRQVRHSGDLPGYAGAVARARLRELAIALAPETLTLLDAVLVHEISAARLARKLGTKPEKAAEQVTVALRALADAYDQAVRAPAG